MNMTFFTFGNNKNKTNSDKPKTIEELYASLPTSLDMKHIQYNKDLAVWNQTKHNLLSSVIEDLKTDSFLSGWYKETEVFDVSEFYIDTFLSDFKKELKERDIDYLKVEAIRCTSQEGEVSFRIKLSCVVFYNSSFKITSNNPPPYDLYIDQNQHALKF